MNKSIEKDFKKPLFCTTKYYKEVYKYYKKIYDNIMDTADITKLKPCCGELREYQLKLLDFAQEWFKLFEELGIEYFIQSGILLGARRNGGFIPWDDDIDIGMMRESYNKFVKYLEENAIRLNTTNMPYEALPKYKALKKYIKKYPNKLIYIELSVGIQVFRGESLDSAVLFEVYPFDYYADDYEIEECRKCLNRIAKHQRTKTTYDKAVRFIENEKLQNKNIVEKSNKIYYGFDHADATWFPMSFWFTYDDIYPLKKIKFENVELYAPNNIDKILTSNYGQNFMQFPPTISVKEHIRYREKFSSIIRWISPFKKLFINKYKRKFFSEKYFEYKFLSKRTKNIVEFLQTII